MQLRPSDEQQQLVDAFAALFGKHASPEQVRAAEPTGFDPQLWRQLLETGAVAMAVDEAHGGWGASLLDLALVAEQLGRHVAPAPLIETQVAARLLARLADTGELAAATLAGAIDGDPLVTLAVRPAVRGTATFLPAAAVADRAIVAVGDDLVLVELEGNRTTFENVGSMPVADVVVPAGAPVLGPATALDGALDDWLTLTGAALVGVGARSLEIGVEYVKERHAWGVPIGSFQGIAHRLADSAAEIDGVRLLTQEAAWAASAEPDRHAELAAMSFAMAYEAARDASYRSLHFHGGYGFMMEYDIQLFYRRARGWARVYGEADVAFRRAADKRYGAVP